MQLKREEDFQKQKSGFEWFKDGERNIKFFHAIVRGRRNRLKLSRIQIEEGEWIDNQVDILEAAVKFFEK